MKTIFRILAVALLASVFLRGGGFVWQREYETVAR